MKATIQNLKRLRNDNALVSIHRDGLDDRRMQGFILHFSDTLVLFQYVFDFHFDGLLILRIRDITSIETTATDDFQRQLLIEEGLFDEVSFGLRPPIRSYYSFLISLPKDQIVILEDETADEPVFIIGTVISVDERLASIRHFTGAGNLQDGPSVIDVERITSCQTATNYISFYADTFLAEAD